MKNKIIIICFSCFLALQIKISAQTITLTSPPNGGNQRSSVTQWIGLVSVTITYCGPDVHDNNGIDRKGHIWGELIHYGFEDLGFGPSKASPWRAGANEMTTISFSHDVLVNGKPIKAGTYGLMLALDSLKPWTWIFSENASAWGTYYYKEAEDVLRINAKPLDNSYTEWLTYYFDNRQAAKAEAWLAWENKKIGFAIEVPDAKKLYVQKMKAELMGYAGFNPANWINAARYCYNNNINLDAALEWVDIAMDSVRFNGQFSFNAMQLKASILHKLKQSIDPLINQVLNHRSSNFTVVNDFGRSLIADSNFAKALEVFTVNAQRNPNEKYANTVSFALVYTALGRKEEALKNWEQALLLLPKEKEKSRPRIESEIKKLKSN